MNIRRALQGKSINAITPRFYLSPFTLAQSLAEYKMICDAIRDYVTCNNRASPANAGGVSPTVLTRALSVEISYPCRYYLSDVVSVNSAELLGTITGGQERFGGCITIV